MNENLALQLLNNVLGWDDISEAEEEISKLRYLSEVKYDGYRNFEPGGRFLENLALWLRQFETLDERQEAYQFIMKRLIFISEKQIDHLVDLLYPQRIFPILVKLAIKRSNISQYKIKVIKNSKIFKSIKRKALFLGMSDGAKIDAFRRKHLLNNEQISVSHELSEEKWKRMKEELEEWMKTNDPECQPFFESIFLVEDFSGSGNSILRLNKKGEYTGKLAKFINDSLGNKSSPGSLGSLCKEEGPDLFVVTYLATEKAIERLRAEVKKFVEKEKPYLTSIKILDPLQILDNKLKTPQPDSDVDKKFEQLLDKYYDDQLEDKHTETGGKDMKHGYAECGLPLVLYHNCPNNSIYLLWGQTQATGMRPGLESLFPRISRHSEER
jgi:hypothetical protein